MVLPLKVRTTLPIDLRNLVSEEILRYLLGSRIPTGRPDLEVLIKDVEELSELRTRVVSILDRQSFDSSNIVELEKYVEGLTALSRLSTLASIPFPWSNSLSVSTALTQNRGIFYEILNILYNIAAMHTFLAGQMKSEAAAACFRKSAGILKYIETDVISQLEEAPPPELELLTIRFLQNIMLARAAALCAVDNVDVWAASSKYKELERQAGSLFFLNKEWNEYFGRENINLATRACLGLANSLARSRKRDDQLLRKGALMKCLDLCRNGALAEEAEKQLNEPLTRRSKSSLLDLEEVTAFIPAAYFAKSDATLTELVSFHVRSSQQFQNSLPFALVIAPFALRQKLCSIIRTRISGELFKLNTRILSALAKCNLPLSIECSMRPTAVPESLASLLTDIRVLVNHTLIPHTLPDSMEERPAGTFQHMLFNIGKEKLAQCDYLVQRIANCRSETEAQLFRSKVKEGQATFQKFEAILADQSELHTLLIRSSQTFDGVSYPEPLLTFLGISAEATHKQKQKSKPMLMTKMQDLFETLRAELEARSRYQIELESRLDSTDFTQLILAYCHDVVDKMDRISERDIQSVFKDYLKSFAKDFVYLRAQEVRVERQIRKIHDMHSQYLSFSRHLSRTDTKLKATQSLMTAAASLLALDSGLKIWLWAVEPLLELLKEKSSINASQASRDSVRDTSRDVLKTNSASLNLGWSPGHQVHICIR